MYIISINSLKPPSGGSPKFQGMDYGANTSFFVVTSAPNQGADKHRHPYEEFFLILDGDIEVIVDGEQQVISGGNITIIQATHGMNSKTVQIVMR